MKDFPLVNINESTSAPPGRLWAAGGQEGWMTLESLGKPMRAGRDAVQHEEAPTARNKPEQANERMALADRC
jgi:hypothetical protein